MRLLGAMADGKRRTSDLVKCIRAGQVDSMALSLALQLPDGFQALNATRIQSHFRGRRVRREFLVRKNAAAEIQATMRGNLWRNRLRKLNWNALWIQAVWRSRRTGWRPWMRRSPMRVEQLHQAATLIEATSRMRKQRQRFLHRKQAATTIQKHVRGRQGRALHKEWLTGNTGPAALAKNRERLMLAMKQAAEFLEDTGMGPKQPAKALEGYMTVYNQAAPSEMSCGVPQLSKVGVKREMRGKLRTIQAIYTEFVSSSRRARHTTPDFVCQMIETSFAIMHGSPGVALTFDLFWLGLQHNALPPSVYEMVACVDWAIEACGSQIDEQWLNAAKTTLQKNGKSWADKQLKQGYVEEAVLSYRAALRYAGEGPAG